MSPSAAVIQRRLREITDLLQYLEGLGDVDEDELTSSTERRLAVERALTQVVDLAVKINMSLVTDTTGVAPADYHQSFVDAGGAGVIPVELADRLAPSAGLRNRLVHEYETIDYAQVATAVRTASREYGRYVREVARHLQEQADASTGDDEGDATSHA